LEFLLTLTSNCTTTAKEIDVKKKLADLKAARTGHAMPILGTEGAYAGSVGDLAIVVFGLIDVVDEQRKQIEALQAARKDPGNL